MAVMNHDRCLRATWSDIAAYCPACDEHVADVGQPGRRRQGIALRGDFGIRPVRHDNLAAYGLPNRVRLHGKDSRRLPTVPETPGRPGKPTRTHVVPIYAYCANPGCGRGMHVELPA